QQLSNTGRRRRDPTQSIWAAWRTSSRPPTTCREATAHNGRRQEVGVRCDEKPRPRVGTFNRRVIVASRRLAIRKRKAPLRRGYFVRASPSRRATDDTSAALSGGFAANALSPFSPKWRATGV